MDVTIANLHISVHRSAAQAGQGQSVLSRAERESKRAEQLARIEEQREQVHTWFALHGGH